MPEKRPDIAIVFDFGGVLLHWDPRPLFRSLLGADGEAVERFLTEIGFSDWNLEQDRGVAVSQSVADLAARFPRYADVIRGYDKRWSETVVGAVPGAEALLLRLRDAGVPLYGLSNWSAETFSRIRPRYGFFNWFEDILLSGDVHLLKPDPRIFRLLLTRIGRTAESCLFVDDNQANVGAAAALGFDTVHFSSAPSLERELVRRGVLEASP